MELSDQLVFVEPSVPRPERFSAPLVSRVLERGVERIIAQGDAFLLVSAGGAREHDGCEDKRNE